MCGGCGGPPLIAKTEDGGETWAVSVGPGDPRTSAILRARFLDESTGFVVLQEGKVFMTSDGGQTWRGLVGSPKANLQFADPEVAWSFAWGGGLVYTVDGGRRWSSREFRLPANATAMSLPRRDRAYIVGEHGMIYRYRIVPTGYKVPLMIAAPLMPGFDTSLDEDAEELAAEVASLEDEFESESGTEDGNGEGDDGEEIAEADGDGEAGGAWSAERYSTRLEKVQATLSAFTADLPTFQGKLRNLNLVFYGLQILNDLIDHGSSAQTALASFRSARDPEAARAALSDLTRSAHALVTTAREASRGKAMESQASADR
jgi:hypothetical protein